MSAPGINFKESMRKKKKKKSKQPLGKHMGQM